ncbi:MAG TPA: hypothetical protein VFE42_34930, partial [Chloroflexota bacterium]|nr:hypothetical protein [Chloroflexota bacterium]
MRNLLIGLGMLALMLALVAVLTLQLLSLKSLIGGHHTRDAPHGATFTLGLGNQGRDAPGGATLTLTADNVPGHGPVALPSDGPYLHTDGALLRDSQGRRVRLSGLNWFGLETCAFAPQ